MRFSYFNTLFSAFQSGLIKEYPFIGFSLLNDPFRDFGIFGVRWFLNGMIEFIT